MAKSVTAIIKELTGSDKITGVPVLFLKMLGDSNAAMLLNQIIYWSQRTEDPDGWFYKSYEDWKQELYLSDYQIKRAIEGDKRSKNSGLTLRDLGVETQLRYSKKAGKTIMHYHLDWPILTRQIQTIPDCLEIPTNHDNVENTDSNNVRNSDSDNVENTTPHNVENTPRGPITENTSENTNIEKELSPPGEKSAAPNPTKPKSVKQQHREDIGREIVVGSLGLNRDTDPNDWPHGRIGKIITWLIEKSQSPNTIRGFYGWYKTNAETKGLSAPADFDKFKNWYMKYLQQETKPEKKDPYATTVDPETARKRHAAALASWERIKQEMIASGKSRRWPYATNSGQSKPAPPGTGSQSPKG